LVERLIVSLDEDNEIEQASVAEAKSRYQARVARRHPLSKTMAAIRREFNHKCE
jgi:hypothetical protein